MKVPRDAVTADEWRALAHDAVLHLRRRESRFQVTGKGALACIQGLVTCDLKAPPDHSRAFGALLTNKGMIVAPLWIEKRGEHDVVLETPAASAAALEEVLAKSIPPRLAAWKNISADSIGVGIYGPKAPAGPRAVARGAAGVDRVETGDGVTELRSYGVTELRSYGVTELRSYGVTIEASDALMETCRIQAGIPRLGAEIDEKTLPQEVRFDELDAVSYTKGCYVGQETVARVHFRGHPNRRLALLVLAQEPGDVPLELKDETGKVVGRLSSACWSNDLDGWVGLAVIRREVANQATLAVEGGGSATVNLDRWLREP